MQYFLFPVCEVCISLKNQINQAFIILFLLNEQEEQVVMFLTSTQEVPSSSLCLESVIMTQNFCDCH